jgi:creatinine amidohydrolase
MRWEELTEPEFSKALKTTRGVCLLPIGCMERHGDHLPLGTDLYIAEAIACRAAQKEPAVVFPPYMFAQINEARCFPGTVALSPALLLELFTAVCDEIARNGFKKIVVVNCHGGNICLLNYFLLSILHSRKDYAVFYPSQLDGPRKKKWDQILKTAYHGHACECETSMMLASHPQFVKMKALKGKKAPPLGRLAHLPPGNVMGWWYADHPEHYGGDATPAAADTGRQLLQLRVDSTAEYLAAVKKDTVAQKLLKEFYDRCDAVGKPSK